MTSPAEATVWDLAFSSIDEQVVARGGGHTFTRAELLRYFSLVENQTNWKSIIDATVEVPTDRDLAGIREAVIFFTGSVPSFEAAAARTFHVKAAGYYQTIGA